MQTSFFWRVYERVCVTPYHMTLKLKYLVPLYLCTVRACLVGRRMVWERHQVSPPLDFFMALKPFLLLFLSPLVLKNMVLVCFSNKKIKSMHIGCKCPAVVLRFVKCRNCRITNNNSSNYAVNLLDGLPNRIIWKDKLKLKCMRLIWLLQSWKYFSHKVIYL